jgi:hypothetical protein
MSSLSQFKKLGAQMPGISFGFSLRPPPNGFRQVLPFKKYWLVILIVGSMLVGFSIPLFTLNMDFSNAEDLFDLTSGLFQLFWGFGWSIAIIFLLTLFVALLSAREVLIVEPDQITLRIEILGLGLQTISPLKYLSNLRYIDDGSITGAKWRDKHLSVDYLDIPISFGSELNHSTASQLKEKINTALSSPIPDNLPDDIKTMLSEKKPLDEVGEQENPQGKTEQDTMVEHDHKDSLLILWFANLVPLGGVFLLDWQVADIMLLFWLESAIIGFFNILKMFRICGPVAIFYSLFFTGHFGAFMSVHLMFIFALFIEDEGTSASLIEVAAVFTSLWPAILALFISHAFSYSRNFLGRQEYLRLTIKDQMQKPYTRVVVMHITIIFGGFLILVLNATVPVLVLLILMKTLVDAKAHIKEHKAAS